VFWVLVDTTGSDETVEWETNSNAIMRDCETEGRKTYTEM
jgi:hypothetical protein